MIAVMRVRRIFVDTALAPGARVSLGDAAAHHLARVLRAAAGDRIVLFDGSGEDFAARIETITRDAVTCAVGDAIGGMAEPPVAMTLLQGVSRGEKMDLTIQKAVELGVATVRPVLTGRGVVRLTGDRAASRVRHWRGVAINACQQCGRSIVPAIEPPAPLEDALHADTAATRLVALPDAGSGLGETLRRVGATPSLSVLIGPEGGLTDRETDIALAAGLTPVRVGPRILRTETAAIALLAIAQHALGDLG